MAPLRALLSRSLALARPCARPVSSSSSLVMSPEVREAISNGEPVVSLESTIITHGMPFPTNMEMALQVEETIRQAGATPATVAIIGGKIHVGLSQGQVSDLATSCDKAVKTSRRDMAMVMARRMVGGTTVSGTMIASHMAGVQVFVTGGIGGVHRGAAETMDISADLTELGRTPVCVVSAGVKSILDIGLTLEYLETQGVCVASYGDTRVFPAFYTRDSGYKAPYNVTSASEAARLVHENLRLNIGSGVLLGVPIPEDQAADGDKIEEAIKIAVEEAKDQNISGREVTPYILSRLNDLTGGESLKANLALVLNNARVGANVAVELARLKNSSVSCDNRNHTSDSLHHFPVVVGGSIYDFVVRLAEGDLALSGGTHRGSLRSSHGGVARNVAAGLARLGLGPRLLSAVGEDREGRDILRAAEEAGMETGLVRVMREARTATYTAFLDSEGDCRFGVGDMEIHNTLDTAYLLKREEELASSAMIVCDGNLAEASIHTLLDIASKHGVPLFYEPADLSKATKPLTSDTIHAMTYTSPNLNELNSMLSTLPSPPPPIGDINHDNVKLRIAEVGVATKQLLEHYNIRVILVTLSEHGVVLVRRGRPEEPLPTKTSMTQGADVSGVWYPCSDPCTSVVSVSGAGDCLTAGFITGVLQGRDQATAVSAGLQAARISCSVSAAVPETLRHSDLNWALRPDQVVLF